MIIILIEFLHGLLLLVIGSDIRSSLRSSPEFTTNGMLPKCWRRYNGAIELFKGGTFGASNTGNEPYSEFYAYQIAKQMNINAIPYGLSKWKGILGSTCKLFTSKTKSFVPTSNVVTSGGITKVEEYYKKLGNKFYEAFGDMIVFDAIICNTDRHLSNFGFLVDNNNKIISPAPLFDHGNSLFNYATEDDYQSVEKLEKYASSQSPCVYNDFFEYASKFMDSRRRKMVRSLINFKFKKHSKYNLNSKRLKNIEKVIVKRAERLLKV